jgi:hypothetical protein
MMKDASVFLIVSFFILQILCCDATLIFGANLLEIKGG